MSLSIPLSISTAIQKRHSLIQPPYQNAFRLLNGFLEQVPNLVLEVFGKTLVIHDHKNDAAFIQTLVPTLRDQLPWIQSILLKNRRSNDPKTQSGTLLFGNTSEQVIEENGVKYAIDLRMNQDASFYLDTQNLRVWLKAQMAQKTLLNTFAYTGSLGVAALAGLASEVIQLDLNRRFLSLAMRSAQLNGYPVPPSSYQNADFFSRIKQYKTSGKRFDCVILDPPVYSKTPKGIIDTTKNYQALINKVRPIIQKGGVLISVHNALFQSGQVHYDMLTELCQDGYLSIQEIIPVPADCIGYDTENLSQLPSDPSPYNHSTKITILRVH